MAGTVFDFTRGRMIAEGARDGRDPQIVFGRGYDHNFVLDAGKTAAPKLAARLGKPASRRVLELLTDQPGMQVYKGNFLNGSLAGKGGHVYRMMLPGSAAIPAPYRDRQDVAWRTGKRIVDMVFEKLKPPDILTRDAFENAVVVNSASGGSTNAPIQLAAIARHVGVDLPLATWQERGHKIPLLFNLRPAGQDLGEDFYHAGGVPAVTAQLIRYGLIREGAVTVSGRTMGDHCRDVPTRG